MKHKNCLEKDTIQERQKITWFNNSTDWTGMKLQRLLRATARLR